MIAATELSDSKWSAFCAAGHLIGAGEVISLPESEEAQSVDDGDRARGDEAIESILPTAMEN